MPRVDAAVLSRATLSSSVFTVVAIVLLLAAPGSARAEGPIARAVRAQVASGTHQLSRPAARWQSGSTRRRGPGRIVAGAAVGATAGFFVGGYLGAVIDGDCNGCDDPGFKGAIIGAPIGAVAGGIIGGKWLF